MTNLTRFLDKLERCETCASHVVIRGATTRYYVRVTELLLQIVKAQDAALEFYADKSNHEAGFSHDGCATNVNEDEGEKAREARASVEAIVASALEEKISINGIQVELDPSIPENEVRIAVDGKVVGVITNLAPPEVSAGEEGGKG